VQINNTTALVTGAASGLGAATAAALAAKGARVVGLDAMYVRTVRNGSWSAQSSLGGAIIGAASASVAGPAILPAARGTDNALWVRTLSSDGVWHPWVSWGGNISVSPGWTTAASKHSAAGPAGHCGPGRWSPAAS
jgi:hypothetical protein